MEYNQSIDHFMSERNFTPCKPKEKEEAVQIKEPTIFKNQFPSFKILIVDDEQFNIEALKIILELVCQVDVEQTCV